VQFVERLQRVQFLALLGEITTAGVQVGDRVLQIADERALVRTR